MFSLDLINQINSKCYFYTTDDVNKEVDTKINNGNFIKHMLSDSDVIFNDEALKQHCSVVDEEFVRVLYQVLEIVSYRTHLNASLSKDKSFFGDISIYKDLLSMIDHFYNFESSGDLERCFMNFNINGLFYDCKDFDFLKKKIDSNPNVSIKDIISDSFMMMFLVRNLDAADIEGSFIMDIGYRAKVVNYVKSQFDYPIQVHFWDVKDFEFNYWFVKNYNLFEKDGIGSKLRVMYNAGMIRSEKEFIESIESLNFSSSF